MGFGGLKNAVKMLIFIGFVLLSLVKADHFLREPDFTDDQFDFRQKRAIPEWQEKWRLKAQSFGQSPEEQEQVREYIDELNSLAREKHPNQHKAMIPTNLNVKNFLLKNSNYILCLERRAKTIGVVEQETIG